MTTSARPGPTGRSSRRSDAVRLRLRACCGSVRGAGCSWSKGRLRPALVLLWEARRCVVCGSGGCRHAVLSGALRASGDILVRPGRSTPSGTGILSPYARAVPGWSGPHPAARNVPGSDGDASASGCRGVARSAPVLSGPRRAAAWDVDWKTWDACGTHSHKRPMSDKPDLSLVHLGGVQGSGILYGNRSTSYGRRRIPDRSGRPSVAVHQSNRQGRPRAPSSGQVRDDVPRGDQGAPGR